MAQTMKAFVMKKLGSVGMMEKPIPDPGPNDAIVKTTAALICTSDVHTVGGAIGERTNLTLGHEAVGGSSPTSKMETLRNISMSTARKRTWRRFRRVSPMSRWLTVQI